MHSIWVAWGIGYEIGVLSSGVKMGINNVGKWDGEMGKFEYVGSGFVKFYNFCERFQKSRHYFIYN